MTVVRRVAGLGAGVAILLPVILLSSVPWPDGGDEAELRISLRLPAVSAEECRPPTAEEVRGVPPHMRPAEICSGEAVPFGMRVVVEGDTLDAGTLRHPGGGRGRALSVYRSYRTAPGALEVEVALWPDSSVAGLPDAPELSLRTSLSLAAGEVALITRGEGGELVVR